MFDLKLVYTYWSCTYFETQYTLTTVLEANFRTNYRKPLNYYPKLTANHVSGMMYFEI